jgi:hypothetical protein
MKYLSEEQDQKKNLAQQREDLKALKDTASRMQQMKQIRNSQESAQRSSHDSSHNRDSGSIQTNKESNSDGTADLPSNAREEWEYLKNIEGAQSGPLDELMGMVGLEDVKATFLEIKSTVDTKLRQNVSLAAQRFSCSMLGNPGTGEQLTVVIPTGLQLSQRAIT